ncbi:MAG: hypothetical protein ACFFAH_12895 [Promethearchaeota archaeon]
MIIKPRYKRQIKCIVLLSIILMTSISAFIFPTDISNSPPELNENTEDLVEDNNIQSLLEAPEASALGNDTWWDKSFQYRRIINVTNQYNVNFTNFGVSMSFNYMTLEGSIQSDLDDIRIVEYYNNIPILRNYFVVQDYPEDDYATVWFDNNITKGPDHSEIDTYMYYGNPDAENAESRDVLESFGYVRNGDFEYDVSEDTKFIPYGWNFTDDPIDSMQGVELTSRSIPNEPYNNTEVPDSWENFHYRLVSASEAEGYEDVGNGDYAYKFGNKANSLPNTQTLDYVGTFFSFPFTVPTIQGAGVKLNLWRNAHTYIFMPSSKDMDYDGYYIRICNGSASKYTYNVDLHEDAYNTLYDNYVEAYGGNAKYAARWREEYQLREHYEGDIVDTRYDLNGETYIDLTAYMGQDVFIEIGSWGREDGNLGTTKDYRGGFFQIDNVGFNYTLTGTLDELQAVDNEVTIVAVDVDGRIVPNVEIFILNQSARGQSNFIVNSSFTADGTIKFTHVPRGNFNITANYTLANGTVVEVFNSSISGDGPYYFNGINYTVQIQLDIWTIDFEVADWNGIPIPYGYIELRKSKGGTWLYNLTLNSKGRATFRWLNDTSYYYKIYYDNEDYTRRKIPLNESYISRNAYIQDDVKYTHHTINLNQTHIGSYLINETIYTDYSNDIGNKKINKATITLENMDDYLEDISIYYIDKDDSTGTSNKNRIYYKQYPSPPNDVADDVIELDISLIDNTNLKNDKFEVYGLLLEINGVNFSVSNGRIKLDLIETCNEYNKTNIARINIKTIYYNEVSKEIEEIGAFIRVNTTGIVSLVNLTSNRIAIPPLENGYAYGQINEVPFWFLRGETYNFTIDVANTTFVDFNVNYTSDPSQWIPGPSEKVKVYNFTLNNGSSLTFKIIPAMGYNFSDYSTLLNSSYSTGSVYWGDSIYLWVEFLYTEDGGDTWKVMTEPPGTCRVVIRLQGSATILFNKKMQFTGSNGIYNLTFDSSKLSAGTTFKNYIFELRGFHPTYDDPTPIYEYIEVKSIPTGKSVHYYENKNALGVDKYFEVIYEEFLNISIRYYVLANNDLLDDATLIYSGEGFGPYFINKDPANPDYFTFLFDSGEALGIGFRTIEITAYLENYTIQVFDFLVDIAPKRALLNGQSNPRSRDWKVWVKDARYYPFTYTDAKTGEKLDEALRYSWEWFIEDDLIEDGYLKQNADGTYTLDFDTETRKVGSYDLEVKLEQLHYQLKDIDINLEIMLRTFDSDLDATNYEDDVATVVQGDNIELEITLWDESREQDLIGATVTLDIGGKEYEFDDEGDGTYTLTYETDDIEAFFTSVTMTGDITIEKEDFVSEEIEITFVITMEEIYPGMPTFYFIMIVSSICGVVGSLIGYRVIQQARIPKFVKKIRAVKKAIKSRGSIPSISITSKNKIFLKELGKEWKDLGISLRSLLGIEEKKSPITKAKELIKQKGGGK